MFAFLLASLSTIGFAAQAVTNKDIVSMVKAGLSPAVILQTIQTSPGQYDTSPQALIALKASNVPDTVIAAMLSKSAGATQPAASAQPPVNQVSNGSIPTQVGVYLVTSPEHYKLIPQEIAYNGSKKGILSKVVTKEYVLELKGTTSQTAVNSSIPTFLVIAASSDSEINIYSIKEIKKDRRRVDSASAWQMSLGGSIHEPDFLPTERNLVNGRPNCYFIKPSAPLQNGEYTFLQLPKIHGTGMQNLEAWSFTVRTIDESPTNTASASTAR